jgi:hypothetical protein
MTSRHWTTAPSCSRCAQGRGGERGISRTEYWIGVTVPFRLDLTVSVLRRLSTNIVDLITGDDEYLRVFGGTSGARACQASASRRVGRQLRGRRARSRSSARDRSPDPRRRPRRLAIRPRGSRCRGYGTSSFGCVA